jgi:hypothetical protein
MNGGSVKIKLVGGLGNQLFIWATAFVIQKKHNYMLSFDASACEQWGCELESFGINIDLKPLRITGNLPGKSSNHVIIQTLRSLRSKSRKLRIGKNFWEKNSRFDPTVFNIKPGKVLCGYFQSYKYFLGFEKDIRKHLTQGFLGSDDYSKLLTQFDGNQWVAIHVRRQDYSLLSETFGLTTERYFVDALKYIESVFPGAKKVVFSDDISEARKLLPNCEFYIGKSDLPSSVETLILMSKSSAIIGSNSSFSWWAAFLSEASDHNKIFPSPWFRDKTIDTSDLVPPSWHRIKNSAD